MGIYALISETKLVSPRDLYLMAGALELNARHCAEAYMLNSPPAIVVIDKQAKLPKGCQPIVFVETGGKPGTLGEHYFDRVRGVPAARVFVQNTPALNSGPYSVCEVASHEILEPELNPYVSLWLDHPQPGRDGVQIAYENCDPTQDHYAVRANGTDWQVSNFVTPHWFRADLVGRPQMVRELERDFGYGLDWCKRLRAPGEIGPEGYAVMRGPKKGGGWRTWAEDAFGELPAGSKKLERKRHPASRTARLGVAL